MGPHNVGALLVCRGGDSRAAQRPSDWALRFPFSDWEVSQGWSGAGLPSQIGLRGGPTVFPLRPAAPQGARTHPRLPPNSLCALRLAGIITTGVCVCGRGGLVSFLLGPKSIWQSPRSRKNWQRSHLIPNFRLRKSRKISLEK